MISLSEFAGIAGLACIAMLLIVETRLRAARRSGRKIHPDVIDDLLCRLRESEEENRRLRALLDKAAFGGPGRKREAPPHGGTEFMQAMRVLGLDPKHSPTLNEVRKAWKRKVKTAHPDQGGTTEDMQRVMRAYEVCRAHAA